MRQVEEISWHGEADEKRACWAILDLRSRILFQFHIIPRLFDHARALNANNAYGSAFSPVFPVYHHADSADDVIAFFCRIMKSYVTSSFSFSTMWCTHSVVYK